MFFFFQAEDGIRDVAVTGVQTCALPISFTMVKTLPREPSRLTFLWAVVSRTKASSRSVVVVGRSMYSRAPERIAFTIACGWAMLPMANKGVSGNSWWTISIARKASVGLSPGTSTKTTSGVAVLILTNTG